MAFIGPQSDRIVFPQPYLQPHLQPYLQPIGLFMLALLLMCLKSPDALLRPQFWAEDGPVFFAAQFQHDWPRWLTPYAGYLHTATRLVAWVASWFDPSHAPLIYNALAILVDAVCVTFVSLRMAAWFPRWAVFLSFFIVPSSGDIFGSATNMQWFMQFALAAACFAPVDKTHAGPRAVRIAGYVALALAALSGPFSVLVGGLAVGALLASMLAPSGQASSFGPANILRAVGQVGSRLPPTNLLIVLACACIQVTVLITNEVRTPTEHFMLSAQLLASHGFSQLPSFYLYTVSHSFLPPQLALLAAMLSVTTACLVYTLFRPAAWNGMACLFLALGAMQPLLAYMKEHNAFTFTATGHYFFLLGVVCCWIVWNLLSAHFPRQQKPVFAVMAALVALGVWFRTDYFRREPLHDLAWTAYAERIQRGGALPVVVPINPAPWYFKLDARTH
jgi:hypothetical protein